MSWCGQCTGDLVLGFSKREKFEEGLLDPKKTFWHLNARASALFSSS